MLCPKERFFNIFLQKADVNDSMLSVHEGVVGVFLRGKSTYWLFGAWLTWTVSDLLSDILSHTCSFLTCV